MPVTQSQVLDRLRRIKGPDLAGNIVDLGLVSEVMIKDGRVYFSITVPRERAEELEPLRQAAQQLVKELPGVTGVTAVLTAEAPKGTSGAPKSKPPAPAAARPEHARVAAARAAGAAGDGARAAPARQPPPQAAPQPAMAPKARPVAGVKHLIAVGSGKGGVGKSTTAVNLALGLASLGLKVGILDADVYGPSQPRLLGLSGRPELTADGKRLKPMQAYGIKVMSMGFMVDEGTPVVWRGPMVTQALNQMLREVAWDDGGTGLDVLVIDLPPGTGDIQLTLAQQVPLSGAVIVSTPQDLALIDARKALQMFRRVDVPVLGIIENMSTFICPKCGTESHIFGHGGAKAEADKLAMPFLGAVPLHMDIRSSSDAGRPVTALVPDGPHAKIFREIAERVWGAVEAISGAESEVPKLRLEAGGATLCVAFPGVPVLHIPAELLRVLSPSAEVQGHTPSQRVTVSGKRAVKIKGMTPVGNYAVRLEFDDGHNTGLYTWPYLETLGREKETRWSEYLAELEEKGMTRG